MVGLLPKLIKKDFMKIIFKTSLWTVFTIVTSLISAQTIAQSTNTNIDVSHINQQAKILPMQHQASNGGIIFNYQDNTTKIVESNDDPLMRSVKVTTGVSSYELSKPNDTSIGSTKTPQKRMSTFKVMDF